MYEDHFYHVTASLTKFAMNERMFNALTSNDQTAIYKLAFVKEYIFYDVIDVWIINNAEFLWVV